MIRIRAAARRSRELFELELALRERGFAELRRPSRAPCSESSRRPAGSCFDSMSFARRSISFFEARDFGGLVDRIAVGDSQIECGSRAHRPRPSASRWPRDNAQLGERGQAAESGPCFPRLQIAAHRPRRRNRRRLCAWDRASFPRGYCAPRRRSPASIAISSSAAASAHSARGSGELVERDGSRARGLRQAVPQLFGEEGHHRMQQAQRRFERRENIPPRRRARLRDPPRRAAA